MSSSQKRILWLLILVFIQAGLIVSAGFAVEGAPPGGKVITKRHFDTSSHTCELECANCHACDLPTKEDPCMVNCPRHMGHFHSEQRPDDGPEIVIIDQLQDIYEPVPFAHELHATMSDMVGGCENCHHYSEPGGAIPPCSECHDEKKGPVNLNKPSLKGAYHRQCLNCHLDWSHQNGCSFCHAEHVEGMPVAEVDTTDIIGIKHPMIEATASYFYETGYDKGPVVTFHHTDHVDQFGLNCVDCHRGDSCSSCHDTSDARTAEIHLTGSCESCTECHDDRGCRFCHDHERKPEFEHGRSTGWELGQRHQEVHCDDCHGEPKVFHTPKTTCASCHEAWLDGDFDHDRTGVVFNEDHEDLDCTDCHVDGLGEPISCEDCHDEDRVWDPERGFEADE